MPFKRIRTHLFSAEHTADTGPLGAKIIAIAWAILFFIFAFQTLLIYLSGAFAWVEADTITARMVLATIVTVILTMGILLVLGAEVWGLWTARPWAWLFFMGVNIIGIPISILQLDLTEIPGTLLFLWYMWWVRHHFGFSKQWPWTRFDSPFIGAEDS